MVPRDDEMCVDARADKITAVNAVFSKEIAKGIRTLKAAAEWSKDVKTPAFRDEAANVYLNIVSKKIEKSRARDRALSFGISIDLPHPLSMNRSVCYVGNNLTTTEQVAEMTQKFLDHGVLGKIKIIPSSLLNNAFDNNDRSMLEKLAEDYDDYFACPNSFSLAWKCLQLDLVAKNKLLLRLRTNGIQGAFSRGIIWENSSKDGYFIKVGQAGLTNKQLRENIEFVVNEIDRLRDSKKTFLNKHSGVKSMEIETGTSAGVTIYQDDTEVDDLPEPVLPAQVIADGISALKETIDWPQEAKVPAFNDEENCIYLNFIPKKLENFFDMIDSNVLSLPHPLSPDRSVIYVSDYVDYDEQARITQRLRDQGILGKIKVVPKSEVRNALELGDFTMLAELAENYDTHFVAGNNRTLRIDLREFLGMKNKFTIRTTEDYEINLGATALLMNSANNGFLVKVGHTGLTDQELQENIGFTIDSIKSPKIFRDGLAEIKTIQLQTGTTEGVTIYQDSSVDEVIGVTAAWKNSVPTCPKILCPKSLIARAVKTLMAAADWSKEKETPAFNDEAATVSLDFVCRKMTNFNWNWNRSCGQIKLPHPLSLHRNVCFIGIKTHSEMNKTRVTQRLNDQGIRGKIEFIHEKRVEKMFLKEDYDKLTALAEGSDLHLLDSRCEPLVMRLSELLAEKMKLLTSVGKSCDVEPANTAMWLNQEQNGYTMKVGHAGLTAQELQENISFAINSVPQFKNIFRRGFHDIQSIQVKTGTVEGAVLQRGRPNIVEDEPQPALPVKVIRGAIEAVKSASDWPKKAKFNDAAATLTLNILSKTKLAGKNFYRAMHLPHPLSLDRSMCFISENDLNKDKQAKITQSFRKAGVLGKIKIIPQSLVDSATTQNDKEGLAKLAALYDTHVMDPKASLSDWNQVKRALAEKKKLFTNCPTPESCLTQTVMWQNSTKTGFLVKVGYTGLTDKQLLENIAAVVKFMNPDSCWSFRNGLDSIKLIRLSLGTTDGVIIHQDDSDEEKVWWHCDAVSALSQEREPASEGKLASVKKEKTSPEAVPLSAKKSSGVKRKMVATNSVRTAKKRKAN